MSGHTQGRLVVLNSFLVPVAHADRKLGGSSDPKRDHDEYAHYIADVKGKRDYHDRNANARRLAAAWNACEDMPTDDIEELAACRGVMVLTVYADEMRENLDKANARIAKLEALVAERDAMLGKRPCQNSRCNELNAARADIEIARKRDEEWREHTTRKALELTDAIFERDAARALLREVSDKVALHGLSSYEWATRIREYLDACDTLDGK